MDPTQEPPFTATARIADDGTVTEMTGYANAYWIEQANANGDRIVAYTPENPAIVGLSFDAKTGVFAQPEPVTDPVAAAYERGKVDGATELLAMQAVSLSE